MVQVQKQIVKISNGPAEPAPVLSPAVRFGNLVFVSGQVAMDLATRKPTGGDVKAQTRQTLRNIQTILEAAGSSLDCVLKCGCYLADISTFAEFNEAYREFFPANPPSRTTVEAKLASPDFVVEIDAIAYIPAR